MGLTQHLSAWTPGTVIDGLYEIEDLIGLGAMGAVYKAHHLVWDIDVAIKVARPDVENPAELRDRLIFEGEAWIGLGVHPNIVQCFFIREYFGLPALFLDYLTGGSLKDWMRNGLIPRDDVARILDVAIQSADGLAYAHSHGMIHRDVKPQNLLIRGDDRVCVTDFGIVKTLSATDTRRLTFHHQKTEFSEETTLGTQVAGTMGYGAPEQWIEYGVVSPASDIYALAVVVYELLAGRKPFEMVDKDPISLLIQQAQSEPPRLQADVPDSLTDLIMNCLARRPEQRPQSAQLLREKLAACYQDVTGQAYPRETPQASTERAATMNNRAASLYLLGKDEKALEVWKEASKVDGRHQESLYNRMRCEWEKDKIDAREAEWKLSEARAYYPMGLFCIQAGHYQMAAEILEKALEEPDRVPLSSIYRALGDAQMYRGLFENASWAYSEAVEAGANDATTRLVHQLATRNVRADKHIYFPWPSGRKLAQLPEAALQGRFKRETAMLALSGPRSLSMWNVKSGKCVWTRKTPQPHLDFDFDHRHLYLLNQAPGQALFVENGSSSWQTNSWEQLICVSTVHGRGLLIGGGHHVLELHQGKRLSQLQSVDQPLVCACFTAQGKVLVGGDEMGFLATWQCHDGQRTYRFQVCQGALRGLAARASAPSVVVVASEKAIRVLDLAAGEILQETVLDRDPLGMELSPDENFVLLRFAPEEGRPDYIVWDAEDGEIALQGSGARSFTSSDYFLRDAGGAVEVWSLKERRRLRRFSEHRQTLTFISTTASDRHMLTASTEQRIDVWELDERHRVVERELMLSRGRSHTEFEITRNAYGRHMAQAAALFGEKSYGQAYSEVKQALRVSGYERDVDALNLVAKLSRHLARTTLAGIWERWAARLERPAEAASIDFLNDVAFTLSNGKVLVHDGRGEAYTLPTPPGVTAFCHLRTSNTLLLAMGNQIQSFDLASSRAHQKTLSLPARPVNLNSSGDGRFAALLTSDGRSHLIEVDRMLLLKSHGASDQAWLATTTDLSFGLSGPDWQLWDLLRNRMLLDRRTLRVSAHRPVNKDGVFTTGALTDDGRVAIASCPEGIISVWDTQTGRCRGTMSGHTDVVIHLAIWNHLHVAVSASRDGYIMFWDLATGSVLKRYQPHYGEVISAFADPFGRFLMTIGADSYLRVWELEWELDRKRPAVSLLEALGPARALDRIGSFLRGR